MGKPKIGMGPDWAVAPHRPLEQLGSNLWRVVGDVPGMAMERTMTVARTAGGGLVLHSAIALDDEGMAALEALGKPGWLVVPNGWHRLDAARYKARYPELKVVSSPGARSTVEKVVTVDHTYDDLPQPDPQDDRVHFATFGDAKKMEGALMVRSDDGLTAVFCDSVFNLPHGKGFFWFVYGRIMGGTGGPKTTPLGRLMMTLGGAKKPFKSWLNELADEPDLVRLVPGHGDVVSEDAAGVARAIAARL
jgi:hypothetical protein